MKPPIILDCEGDLEAFASQEDALNHAEPTDVKDGAYRAFDSEGRSGSCPSSPLGVIPSAESVTRFGIACNDAVGATAPRATRSGRSSSGSPSGDPHPSRWPRGPSRTALAAARPACAK